MADSLVALFVITLAINLVVLCEFQLIKQQQNAQQRLAAARLGKEASDQYRLTTKKAEMWRGEMRAQANRDGVVVVYQGRPILRVRP